MKFAYKGKNKQAKEVSGYLEAVDGVEAKMKLRAMQVRPTMLKIVPKNTSSSSMGFDFGKLGQIDLKKLNQITIGPAIPLKTLLIFIRQFSSLIDAGVPLVQGLTVLSDQQTNKIFQQALVEVKSKIEAGSTLASAMGDHSKIFPEIMVSLVEAGEISGTLDVTLRRIGLQLEKQEQLRKKVKGAMMYPMITLVVSTIVLLFLLIKVIPEVAKMYGDSGSKLPDMTLMVLSISDWVQAKYGSILMGIASAVMIFSVAYKQEKFRLVFDPIILKVPLFGELIRQTAIARMSRTLSVLVGSGVPLLGAFQIVEKIVDNRAIKSVIRVTANSVTEGKSIAHGMASRGIFPNMVVQMVSIGEISGRLDELMGKVAEMYEEEVDATVSNLTSLIQPVLIVGVGGIIMFLLLAMYLPIFQLAEKATVG